MALSSNCPIYRHLATLRSVVKGLVSNAKNLAAKNRPRPTTTDPLKKIKLKKKKKRHRRNNAETSVKRK
jgi:hypothetical protein